MAPPVGLVLGVVAIGRARRRRGVGMAHAVVGTTLGALGVVALAGLVVLTTAGLLLAPALAEPASQRAATAGAAAGAEAAPAPDVAAAPLPAPTPDPAPTPVPTDEPEPFADLRPTSSNGRESEEVLFQEEQDYLDALYEDTYQSFPDADLITWGWEVCFALDEGYLVWEAEEYLLAYRGVTIDHAFDIAYEARAQLCPRYASV